MAFFSIDEAANALRRRQISSVELAEECLGQAKRLQPKLNAFLRFTEESALAEARTADADFAAGKDHGPLHGIPVALKDLFFTKGVNTTAGSKVLADYVPDHDAAVVEKLRSAGAVLLGKLGMHELAFGITSNNAHYGAIRNAWDTERIPGGSSGGSGVAVSAGMVFAAMGSDTGGSIRIPASYCGTAGIKPTYGLVSRYGSFPLGFTLDHMGPLARSSRDCAHVLNAIAGPDQRDPYCSSRAWKTIQLGAKPSMEGVRIGVSEQFFFDNIDPEIRQATESAVRAFHEWGATIVPLELGWLDDIVALSHVILPAEAAAAVEPHLSRREDFGSEVLPLFEAGKLIPAYEYLQAQRLRRMYRRRTQKEIWERVDLLLGPTTSITAPRIGETTVTLTGGAKVEVRAASTRLVRAFNVLGTPAHSFVAGLHSNGLPMSLQVVGPAFGDGAVLAAAARFEDELGLHKRVPAA